jgi:hypothetical protein
MPPSFDLTPPGAVSSPTTADISSARTKEEAGFGTVAGLETGLPR